jgi:hypothetical protein
MRRLVLFLGLLSVTVGTAFAQTGAEMTGEVRDSSGALAPNASVTVTNTETNITRSSVTELLVRLWSLRFRRPIPFCRLRHLHSAVRQGPALSQSWWYRERGGWRMAVVRAERRTPQLPRRSQSGSIEPQPKWMVERGSTRWPARLGPVAATTCWARNR